MITQYAAAVLYAHFPLHHKEYLFKCVLEGCLTKNNLFKTI